MLQALLNGNDVQKVDTAENGLEAIHATQENPLKYDIIFMDNFMPVMVK
jgi:CheY-like chemotaxis protein